MGSRKKVKKKPVKRKSMVEQAIAKVISDLPVSQMGSGISEAELPYFQKWEEAVECLKHYAKRDQIGDLANQAIELLVKWGKLEPGS